MAEITSKASFKSIFHKKKTGKKADIWPRPMLLRPPCESMFIFCQSMREWWLRTDRETLTGFIGACGETSLCSAAAWSRLGSKSELHSNVFCQFTESIFFWLFGEIFEEVREECLQAAGVYHGGRLSELKEIVSIQQHMSHLRGHKVNMGIIPLPKLNQNGFLWVCVWVRVTCQRSRHGSNQVPQQRMKRHQNKPENLERTSGQRKG